MRRLPTAGGQTTLTNRLPPALDLDLERGAPIKRNPAKKTRFVPRFRRIGRKYLDGSSVVVRATSLGMMTSNYQFQQSYNYHYQSFITPLISLTNKDITPIWDRWTSIHQEKNRTSLIHYVSLITRFLFFPFGNQTQAAQGKWVKSCQIEDGSHPHSSQHHLNR
ncbi:hypothetical protein CIPAW_10G030400 [Carya illinoinensis]|uniref:Uncharacterized protein n=1 Tax=Carya illinoinensis TaxID=32201 RepID=A0A8T1PBJ7_CARIL|nr:hypothetical protein CIPAW_10G030400 [Carya illinoinensis]